ncbi:arginyltransferase [Aliikangiella sp. IMCC44653]
MASQFKPTQLSFYLTPAHDCPYLPQQLSKTMFLSPEVPNDTLLYTALINKGFRRSGEHIYRPHCDTCQACISVRVPSFQFKPNKQQRRCLKGASKFRVSHEPAHFNQTHYQLFENYINARHKDGDMYPASAKQYQEFLLTDWLDCRYLNFYDIQSQQLVACCVYDQVDDGLSAVYTFFDPAYAKFSLGRLAILKLIELCKQQLSDYVYLGYWIKNSQKMAYKGEYRPLECFVNEQWVILS